MTLEAQLTTRTSDTNAVDMTVELYAPHRGQMRIHKALETHRFVTAVCGRRFGKTLCGDNELIKHACAVPYSVNWWVAPSYRQAETPFEQAARACYHLLARKPNETKLKLTLKNGAIAEFRSADNYENLRGDGPNFIVVDEARKIRRQAWEDVLRPAIADHESQVLFITTPQGHDWVYGLYANGQDPLQGEYASLQLPTSANPFIPRREIEHARRTLPDRTFRQEFLAEFIDDAGVFRNVNACIGGVLAPPVLDHTYVLGWDIAKYQDFSVMTVIDVNLRRVVAWKRLNLIEYPLQIAHVATLAHLYNDAAVIMDSTGVGDPIFDMLRQLGMTVEGYYLTNASKNKLIDELVVAIEHVHVQFPNIPELVNELNIFSYKITEARNIVYSAPDGMHDDCVFSLALAVHGIGSNLDIAIAGRSRRADEEAPRAWETKDEVIERRQAQAAHVLQQLRTGQGLIRTQWGAASQGNRFEEDDEGGIA